MFPFPLLEFCFQPRCLVSYKATLRSILWKNKLVKRKASNVISMETSPAKVLGEEAF